MFMVLSSWQNHCESSPGSFGECRTAPSGRQPKTKPADLDCESACTGCQSLHPPSPFIIITILANKSTQRAQTPPRPLHCGSVVTECRIRFRIMIGPLQRRPLMNDNISSKNSYLSVLKKVKNWSYSHIRTTINTVIQQLLEGHPFPTPTIFGRCQLPRSWVILLTNRTNDIMTERTIT